MEKMINNKVRNFKDLIVWNKAHNFVLEVYKITKLFPKDETYGLVSQLRRASVSITTNIVEGHKRKGKKDFLNFLNISDSSLEESKYLIFLSKELGYIEESEFNRLFSMLEEIGKILCAFQKNLLETF